MEPEDKESALYLIIPFSKVQESSLQDCVTIEDTNAEAGDVIVITSNSWGLRARVVGVVTKIEDNTIYFYRNTEMHFECYPDFKVDLNEVGRYERLEDIINMERHDFGEMQIIKTNEYTLQKNKRFAYAPGHGVGQELILCWPEFIKGYRMSVNGSNTGMYIPE